MKNKREHLLKIAIWWIVGIIISFIFVGIHISETGNMKKFYDVGSIYEFPEASYEYSVEGIVYHEQQKITEIAVQNVYRDIPLAGNIHSWNNCQIKLLDLNRETVTVTVQLIERANIMHSVEVELEEGDNIFPLNGEVEFDTLRIGFPDSVGAKFVIKDIWLKQKIVDDSFHRICKLFVVAFTVYFLVSIILYGILKKYADKFQLELYKGNLGLQKLFYKIADTFPDKIKSMPYKTREIIWTLCFFVMIFYTIIIYNCGKDIAWWNYTQLIYSALLIITSIFAVEKDIKLLNWNHHLVRTWTILWIVVCVSDFFVSKKFWGVGYIQIFIWGFFFFVWNNMENPQRLIDSFMRAVLISFGISTAFCMLCRLEVKGYRYQGLFTNPNNFGDYLVVVAAVVLTIIVRKLTSERKENIVLECIAASLVLTFLWKTQSRAALGGVAIISIIAFSFILRKQGGSKRMLKWILLMLIVFLPVETLVSWSTSNIPIHLGTIKIMERDSYKPVLEDLISIEELIKLKAYAAEDSDIKNTRIVQSFMSGSLEKITSGRTIYWKTYIRNMNLLGHEWKEVINGERHDSHNALLAIAHRYGVFTMIPYMLLWMYSIIYAVRYAKKGEKNGFLPLALCSSYMCVAIWEAAEQPYINLIWFAMYFIIGILFQQEERGLLIRCSKNRIDE